MKRITKKSKHIFLLVILLLSGLLVQSQTPSQNHKAMEKYYKQGDYVNATLKAMDYLRTNGRNKGAQKILSISFNMAVENVESEINNLIKRSKTFSGDETVIERKKIISDYELLKKLERKGREIIMIIPKKKVSLKFDKINVSSELETAQKSFDESKKMAADMHYNRGLVLMNKADRESQKSAAIEFRHSEYYFPNYKDSKKLYNEARKKGTTRVAILPFDNLSGVTRYGAVGSMISDHLRSAILNNSAAREFIEIFTRDQLNLVVQEHNLDLNSGMINPKSIVHFGEALGVHLIITGKVMQLTAEQPQTINDAGRINSVNAVVGQEKYVDSKGRVGTRNVWGKVSAYNFQHHKSATATINGSYEVIDIESGRVVASSQFSKSYEWTNNWSTYRGDQRAAYTPAGFDASELPAPSPTELANKVIAILGNKIAQKVINFIK